MKSLLAFSLTYSVANANTMVLKTSLPGTVTKTHGNLEAGLHGDLAPKNRAELEAAHEHLKEFRPAL